MSTRNEPAQALRLAGALLGTAVLALAVLGPLLWITARTGPGWNSGTRYAAGVAWEALLMCACRLVYLARRHLHWRKHQTPEWMRREDRAAEALWPRRGGH